MGQPPATRGAAVRSIERRLIGDRLGALPPPRHPEVKRALGYALDWPELKTLGPSP